jgi:uncharacterized protein (DUF433 family)
MSVPALEPMTVPLRQDEFGGLRVAETRVLLELIVRAYHAGATPEEIVQAYDVLKLRDVYAVVAWCLSNETAVQEYMTERERQASTIRNELHAIRPVNTELLQSLRTRQQLTAVNAEQQRVANFAARNENAATGE